jgi:hypothetical protein
MARFLTCWWLFWVFQAAGLAAEVSAWGPAVSGLQLGVALVSGIGGDTEIEIMVRCVSNQPLLLPLGWTTDTRVSNERIRLIVSTSGGQFSSRLLPASGGLSGRLDPLAIPMLPNTSYTFRRLVTEMIQETGRGPALRELIRHSGELWAVWDAVSPPGQPEANCPFYGTPNSNQIACWDKGLVSNRLTLPR